MALTAKFTADFSQFESAIKGAAVTVTTFEKGVKNAAADLSKLASSLSGAEIQRQATLAAQAIESIGGATKLTAAEAAKMAGPIDAAIAKYKALGQQVPPELEKISRELQDVQKNAQKAGDGASGIGSKFKSELAGIGPAIVGAFSVGAIVGFGKELLALGAEIEATSQKLGISTDAVQELQYAAEQTGTTLDTFAGGMVKLQDKLQEGSKGTLAAFERLNLSIEDVKRQGVDQAFTAVAEAIGSVQDPMEQTQLAMELFGKAGVEALPAIRQGMSDIREEAKKLGAVMSEENIKALDDFDQRLENTFKQIQIGATKSIGYIGDLFNIMTSLPWNAIAESIQVPDLPAAKPIEVDTGARTRATAELTEGYKRANAVLDEHIATTKKAADAAAAHAKAIEALRDQLSGAALQADIKKLAQAWDGLTDAQKDSDAVLKRILPTLEDYVRAGGKLPPILQKIYDEHRRAQTAVADLTGGISKALPILGDYATKLNAPVDALKSLRLDGLLPAIPLTEKFGTVLEAAGNKSQNVVGQFRNAEQALADLQAEARELAQAELGKAIGESLIAGIAAGSPAEAIRGVVTNLTDALAKSIQESAAKSIGGLVGGLVGTVAGGVVGLATTIVLDSGLFDDIEDLRAQTLALRTDMLRGFGGERAFRDLAEAAGLAERQIAAVMETWQPDNFARQLPAVIAQIDQFRVAMQGLQTAAGGTTQIGGGLTAQFADSAELTAENVDRINALGTILGGVIANTAGKTGDLVGAIRSVGPAIEQIEALKEKFDLGDALSPATAEVLKLYDTIRANEDVFGVIQGLGQVMSGMGDAMIANTTLANTFGGELAQQFAILTNRGVDAHVALAAMAPALQELWELSEQGTITVDETTQALLNQAEAQGVVGASMREANEQILEVLVEIRDLFAGSLPGAIARTASASRDASGVVGAGLAENKKQADELAASVGPQLGIAARTGQLAVLTAAQQEQIALEKTKKEAEKLAAQLGPGVQNAAGIAGSAIDALSRRSITIPIHFDMDEPPDMPDYPAPSPPTQPGDAGTAQAASAPQSAGHTEVNFNVDGTTLARIVASKLPGVVNGYVVN